MKSTIYELRQLRTEDERLYRFKEANFEANGYDAFVPKTIVWLVIFSLPIIGIGLLLLFLLVEWYLKLFRMTMIMFKEIKLMLMRFDYTKLLLVLLFLFISLFILANVFK